MGGNAFKDCKVLTREENAEFEDIIERALLKQCSGKVNQAVGVRRSKYKETFNDVDLVVGLKDAIGVDEVLTALAIENIIDVNNVEYQYNPPILSVKTLESVQVDLIFVPKESVDFARCLHGYDNLGIILTRLAASLGVTLLPSGLYLKEAGEYFSITNNFKAALAHLGIEHPADVLFNAETIEREEDSRDKVWTAITKSTYFTPSRFDPQETKPQTARLLENNPTYMAFWDKARYHHNGPKWFVSPDFYRIELKTNDRLLQQQIIESQHLTALTESAKQLINAYAVSSITGMDSLETAGKLAKQVWNVLIDRHGGHDAACKWVMDNSLSVPTVIVLEHKLSENDKARKIIEC